MDIALLRFREDKKIICQNFPDDAADFAQYSERVRRSLYSHAVLVSKEIFPDIYNSIIKTREKLSLDIFFQTFIKPDPIPNAQCIFLGGDHRIAIVLTSSLVQLMSYEELKFVIGHELGHFLFKHYLLPSPEAATSEIDFHKRLYLKRCAEISADRVGFVAAPSIEDSLRAKLKIASGLPETFFRLNISSYIAQLREIKSIGKSPDEALTSHPILPLRTRALLWFSMSEQYYRVSKNKNTPPISRDLLDDKVSSDLDSIASVNIKKMEEELINNATLWTALKVLSSSDKLSKKNQEILKKYIGEELVEKALNFLKASHGSSLQIINERFEKILLETKSLTGGVNWLIENSNKICSELEIDETTWDRIKKQEFIS